MIRRRSRHPAVNTLLHQLDEAQQSVDQTKKVVEDFLANLTRKCDAEDLWVTGSKFVGVGSSYEGTAVSRASDFDVALVLAPPLSTDNFQIIEVSEIGLFKLQYKNTDKGALKHFINDNDYLKVKEFRNCIFNELHSVVGTITLPGYTIKRTYNDYESVCSFKVQLQEVGTEKKLDFDIVPMIKANCELPHFNMSALPDELQSYVRRHNSYAMFSLAPPPRLGENYKHLVVQTAFGLLEQEAMKIVTNKRPPKLNSFTSCTNENKLRTKKQKTCVNKPPKMENRTGSSFLISVMEELRIEETIPIKEPAKLESCISYENKKSLGTKKNQSRVNKPPEMEKRTVSSTVIGLIQQVRSEEETRHIKPPVEIKINKRDRSVSQPKATQVEIEIENQKKRERLNLIRSKFKLNQEKVKFCLDQTLSTGYQKTLLRDSVLVTKYVAKENKWNEIGIKSFHIKRVAIALCKEIKKMNDPWAGYRIICDNLYAMLKNNIICGVFLKGQNIYIQDTSTPIGVPSVAEKLRKKCLNMKSLRKEML